MQKAKERGGAGVGGLKPGGGGGGARELEIPVFVCSHFLNGC